MNNYTSEENSYKRQSTIVGYINKEYCIIEQELCLEIYNLTSIYEM